MTRQEIEFALQEIYIGLLGRAADPAGLDYWADEVEAGTITLEQVRTNIVPPGNQPEYDDVFGGLTRAQTVNQLYLNLFGRPAEAEGLNYWVNGGGATVPVDLLVFALSDGADATDRLVLDNKVTVAQYFTANHDFVITDPTNLPADFKAAAAIVVADVDGTPASVDAAKAMVDAGSYFVGEEFVLTGDLDNFDGTAGDDTFLATDSTLQNGDDLDGGAGNDMLKIAVSGEDFFAAPSIRNIETIRVIAPNNTCIVIEINLSFTDSFITLVSLPVITYVDRRDDIYIGFWVIQDDNNSDFFIIDTFV